MSQRTADPAEPRRSKRLREADPERSSRTSKKSEIFHRQHEASAGSSASDENDAKSTASTEVIEEDDYCPICHLLLYRPVTTRCNHTLCESCMAHWADVSVTTQMRIVDVDEIPEAFDAVSGLEANCPMCRTQTIASFNPEIATKLSSKYPQTWQERSIEEADNFGEQGSIQTLTVYIGNRHRLVPAENANSHEWIFFVKPSRTDIIEEVQLILHPTFRPNRIIRQRPPYEIKRLGWGTFTVTAYVILKPSYTWVSSDSMASPDGVEGGMLPLEWKLDFEGFGGRGSMGGVRLKVRNDRDWRDGGEEVGVQEEREWERVVRSYRRDGRYEPDEEE